MFFERHQGGERAVLVQLQLDGDGRDPSMLEFEELVGSAGGAPVAMITGSRRAPHARTFVGEGKLEEIAACAGRAVRDAPRDATRGPVETALSALEEALK